MEGKAKGGGGGRGFTIFFTVYVVLTAWSDRPAPIIIPPLFTPPPPPCGVTRVCVCAHSPSYSIILVECSDRRARPRYSVDIESGYRRPSCVLRAFE